MWLLARIPVSADARQSGLLNTVGSFPAIYLLEAGMLGLHLLDYTDGRGHPL